MITLKDIKDKVLFSYDLTDDEYDTWFYADIANTDMAEEIEVTQITDNAITCRFSEYLRTHKDYMKNFIKDTYYEPYKSIYLTALDNEKDSDEDWAHLIEDAVRLALEDELQGDI